MVIVAYIPVAETPKIQRRHDVMRSTAERLELTDKSTIDRAAWRVIVTAEPKEIEEIRKTPGAIVFDVKSKSPRAPLGMPGITTGGDNAPVIVLSGDKYDEIKSETEIANGVK